MGVSIAGYASTSNTLLNFRTAYLRFVANAWGYTGGVDGYLADKFNATNQNDIYITENILNNIEFKQLLPGYTKGSDLSLPWTAQVKVRYDLKNGPEWDPGVTAGWSGPNDNFEILLPPKPGQGQDQYDMALAAYFQQFPTLLGHKRNSVTEVDGSAANFVEFGNVIMQAIAQSWSEDRFNGVIGNNEDEYTFRELLLDNGIKTLSRFYGYNNPWNFDVKFLKAEEIINPAPYWDGDRWAGGELYNTIILNMPNKPEADNCSRMNDVVRPVALATYNANGAHYPFTCP